MFTDVMVDIETTSSSSFDNGAIIQIAGVKFNYDTEDVDTRFFDAALSIPPGRYWDESTRQWWSKQKPEILKGIQARARDPRVVMREFYDWLLQDYPQETKEGLRFWGKPTHFDFSFIASYFNQYGLTNPCSFRHARDLNSFMAGLSGTPNTQNLEDVVEFVGDKHNAIFDSLHQIKMLFHQKNRFTASEIVT